MQQTSTTSAKSTVINKHKNLRWNSQTMHLHNASTFMIFSGIFKKKEGWGEKVKSARDF